VARNNKSGRQQQNQLRIIGGTWRGRKLNFPNLPGLRPTSDRIRETLFNWLQVDVIGANVLDLFAGSGALGLEALSREARQVVFIDSQKLAVEQIRSNAQILGADNAEVVLTDANSYMQSSSGNNFFDLIFLDPPFHQNMLMECLLGLQKYSLLNDDAKVYVESEAALDEVQISQSWKILKSKTAGNVYYYLLCLNEGL